MNKSDQFDQQLKQALSSSVEPGDELNRKLINRLKEKNDMKPFFKKRKAAVLIAAALTLVMSLTAFAAWNYLSPKEVAEHFGDKALAHAFDDKNAVEINKSATSGDYLFTLHGIVSGKNLSDFKDSAHDINADKTYAVVSIAKKDGSKMPSTRDEEYGKVSFFVSPLIKGQKPWQYNIASMNGGYSECVVDGVMYRLLECDGIEMFADRGLYLGICTSAFYDTKAFNYNQKTGEISLNTNYEGANALFDLPLDIKKADHDKAEKYLKELWQSPKDNPKDEGTKPDGEQYTDPNMDLNINPKLAAEKGVVIPESVKEVTCDKDGMAKYDYKGFTGSVNMNALFKKDETGTKTVSMTKIDGKLIIIQYSKDANGKFTARALEVK